MGSAISKAWTLRSDKLQEVDLFDARNVPALLLDSNSQSDDVSANDVYQPESPSLYVGMYSCVERHASLRFFIGTRMMIGWAYFRTSQRTVLRATVSTASASNGGGSTTCDVIIKLSRSSGNASRRLEALHRLM